MDLGYEAPTVRAQVTESRSLPAGSMASEVSCPSRHPRVDSSLTHNQPFTAKKTGIRP